MTRPTSRARAALGALLMCAVTLPLLSGCTLFNRVFHRGGRTSAACHERPFAGNADSRPGLKVPEGMSAQDTRNAVKVPTLSAADRERPKSEPCLAQPPNFFAKPLQPATGKPLAPAPAPAVPATPATATPVPAPTTPAPTTPASPPPVPRAAPGPTAPAAPAPPVEAPGEPAPPG